MDLPVSYIPGQLLRAIVTDADGKTTEAIVYLSLRVDGTNAARKDHCWRYAPPSHEVVSGTVTPIEYVTHIAQ
jgi:hypothetical protein